MWKGGEQQLLESLHCGGGVSGAQAEGSRPGVGLVEMLCASPEEEGEGE